MKTGKCFFNSLRTCVSIGTCRNIMKENVGINRTITTSVSHWKNEVNEVNNHRRYNVGVLGAGRIAGTVHLNNILRDRRFKLQWVIEDDSTQAEVVKNNLFLDDVPFFKSSSKDSLLSEKSLDAVFIFTPTQTHADYIYESLNKGKSVMVEKPTAENATDIKMCYEAAEKNGKVLLTAYNRRFDQVFLDMWKSTSNGTLGDLQLLKLTTRDCPKPSYEFLKNADTSGCNIISDLAIHDIDMSVWLTNCARPESIYTVTHVHDDFLKDIGEPDTLTMTIKYESGLIATIDVVRESVYGYDIRLELFGTKGMAVAENPRRSTSVIDLHDGAVMQPLHYSFPQRFEKAFQMEVSHFCDCLSGISQPLITKEECLLSSAIVSKAVESYKLGQAVKF